MAMRQEITAEQVLEIKAARKVNKNKNVEKRLKALLLYAEGKSRSDVALETGYAATYIAQLVLRFMTKGLDHIVGNNYTGNRRLLSMEEEAKVLEPFIEKAERGQILEVSEIKKAYEDAIGRELNSKGQIYEVLKRHNFRKVISRNQHPNKSCDTVIDASKNRQQNDAFDS